MTDDNNVIEGPWSRVPNRAAKRASGQQVSPRAGQGKRFRQRLLAAPHWLRVRKVEKILAARAARLESGAGDE